MAKTTPLSLADFPKYANAADRLTELHRERNALEDRLESLRTAVRGTSRTAALISIEAAQLTTAPPDNGPSVIEQWQAIDAAEKRLSVLTEAIKRQTQITEDEKRIACQQIRERVVPEQRKYVADIAECVRELQKAVEAEQTFRDHYQGQGVSLHNPSIHGADVFEHWFKEQTQLGLLDR